jgi:hypothetical protein
MELLQRIDELDAQDLHAALVAIVAGVGVWFCWV